MATPVVPNLILLQLLNQLRQAGSLYNPATIRLYQNNVPVTLSSQLSDFEDATFEGYSESSDVVWSPPFYASDGTPTLTGDVKQFLATAPLLTPNTIYGWIAVGPAEILTPGSSSSSGSPTDVLLFGLKFDNPIQMTAAGQGIEVLPRVTGFLPS